MAVPRRTGARWPWPGRPMARPGPRRGRPPISARRGRRTGTGSRRPRIGGVGPDRASSASTSRLVRRGRDATASRSSRSPGKAARGPGDADRPGTPHDRRVPGPLRGGPRLRLHVLQARADRRPPDAAARDVDEGADPPAERLPQVPPAVAGPGGHLHRRPQRRQGPGPRRRAQAAARRDTLTSTRPATWRWRIAGTRSPRRASAPCSRPSRPAGRPSWIRPNPGRVPRRPARRAPTLHGDRDRPIPVSDPSSSSTRSASTSTGSSACRSDSRPTTGPTSPEAAPELVEEYTYTDLKLNVGLGDVDFDVSNTDYAFGRF